LKNSGFFGISFLSCGVFDTSNIISPFSMTRSPVIKTDKYVVELPFEVGGKNFINDVDYSITPDSIFFVKPGSRRYTVYPLKCLCLHFNVSDQRFVKIFESIPTYSKLQNRDEVYKCFLELIYLFTDRPENFEIPVLSAFFRLLELILENNSANTSDLTITLPRNAVIKAKNHIELHYNTKITLEQLSSMVNLSPIYFQRIFTAATGKTPHRYLLDKRLSVAKELLLVSNHSLTEISNLCGFSSQSRFNIVFKQNEGLTPTEYKNKNRIDSI